MHGVQSHSGGNAEIDAVPEVHPVRDHRALRMTGRARGVHDRADVVVGELRANAARLAGERGDDRFVRIGRCCTARVDAQQRPDAAAALELLRRLGELPVVNQHLGRAVVQDVLEFRHGEPPVQQHRDRTGAPARELHIEKLDAVMRQQRHPVAAPYPHRRQPCGQRIGARVQIGIGKPALGAEFANGLLFGTMQAVVGQPVVRGHRAPAGRSRTAHRRHLRRVGFEPRS